MELRKVYDELYGMIEDLKKQINGGGGSKDYDKLDNRPKINNITLTGNKKSSDLKIGYSMTESEYAAATKNAESIYCLQENATTLTDSAYVNLEVADWTEASGVYKQTKPFVFEVTPAAGWTIEDVSIETGIATVDSYEVTEDPFGLSITYAAETLPEYGITATVTVTINQPAGSTRIIKNGIEFGKSKAGYTETELFANTTEVSTYPLSSAYTGFDMIGVLAASTTVAGAYLYGLFPVSQLAVVAAANTQMGITAENDYVWFKVDNATTFSRVAYKNYKIVKIIGIKF